MSSFADLNKKIIFIHVPRSGGSSVTKTFFDNSIDFDGKIKEDQTLVRLGRFHWPMLKIRKEFPDLVKECQSVAIVRNPWSWIFSMYHYAKRKLDHPLHDMALEVNFDQFVPYFIENEKRDMCHFVCDKKNNVIVDKILKFENFYSEVTPILSNLFEKPFSLHDNKSTAKPLNFKDFYTAETHAMVVERYKEDIRVFDYTKIQLEIEDMLRSKEL